jgi:hypothetical protein
MAVCHYHPDRTGVGVCVRCQVVICSACCTRLDGVNHCHACLQALGRRAPPSREGGSLTALAVVGLGIVWLVAFGAAWLVQGMLAP